MKNKTATAVANKETKFDVTVVPIDSIKPNEDNPRSIKDKNLKKLVNSIIEFPQMLSLRPIIVDDNDVILAGNMRHKAAKIAGLTDVPVIKASSLTQEQTRQFIVKDNASFGDWELEKLLAQYTLEELDAWSIELPELELNEDVEVEDDNFEIQEDIQTNIVEGDLIEIGRHRLICGDATDSGVLQRLCQDQRIEIAFTSPPYNAGKTPTELKMNKSSKYISNEDNKTEKEYLDFLVSFTNNTLLFAEYSFVNIQSLAGNKIALIEYLNQMKSVYSDTIVWNKKTSQPAMANNVLNSQFEYIHVFNKKATRAIGTKKFRGTLSNLIEISKQTNNEIKIHNATFSIDFASHFVLNFCEETVLDVFGGTGTTMLVAEQLKKTCFMVELEPKYCQAIIDRMKKHDATIVVKVNGIEQR